MNTLNLSKDDRIPDLKPCAHCGGAARLVKKEGYGPAGGKYSRGYVRCSKCDVTTPTRTPWGKALALWNRRHDETPSEFERLCGKENSHV